MSGTDSNTSDPGNSDAQHGSSPPTYGESTRPLPDIVRIATRTAARSAARGLGSSLRSAKFLARSLAESETAGVLPQAVARDIAQARRAIGDAAREVLSEAPLTRPPLDATTTTPGVVLSDNPPRDPGPTLRERGERLLQRSRDVWSDEASHPAYARILEDLAPDEARILLVLFHNGPQPSIDVRTGGPVGLVSSALIAEGMSMIGPRAGCRHLDEVPAYLGNLVRLGLIRFSTEQLEDPMEYPVVEAQPEVLAAMHSVRFPKVVRRSIRLTPFGIGFCRACLVDQENTTLPAPHVAD